MKTFVIDNIRFVTSIMRGRRLAFVLLAANLFLLTLYVTGWSSTVLGQFGPQSKKRVEKHSSPAKEPIEIFATRIRNTPVALGKEFDSESDWLKDLRFRIRNKSQKPITWIGINLLFPETRMTGPVMVDQLFLGQRPDMKTKNPPLELKPGEELEVSMETHFDSIKRLVESRGRLDNVNRVDINVDEVMFADGTLYSGDALWRPNPDTSSPHKWVKIDPEVSKP
jgi:hypothetical protein